MKIFNLPDLGEGLPDAEIREWYVNEGDTVKVDQPMVAMETAKAVVDVPSPRSGKIIKLYGKAGDVIITGSPLVEFEKDDAVAPAKEKSSTVVGNLESSDTVLVESATGIKPTSGTGGIKAIPAVRALAKKLNIDLAQVKGTGPGGQITLQDVENAPFSGTTLVGRADREGDFEGSRESGRSTTSLGTEGGRKPAEGTPAGFEPLKGVRRAMANVMTQSHREVVPITLVDDADLHAWPEKTDITLRVVRAITVACKTEPSLNAWYDTKSNSRKIFNEIHLGLAIDSEEGLFVPVLKDIQKLSNEDLRTTINRFKEQVKARTIPQDDLKGATIVLSNVGIFAGKYASPIIVPPTVAILATGKIRDEVVPFEGKPAVHRILPLSLSIDHRAITGGEAARFLAALIKDLQAEK